MIDVSRYSGILRVGLALALTLAAIDLAFSAVIGPELRSIIPSQVPNQWSWIDAIDRRVSALVSADRPSQGREKAPLCVYLGMSTAREGIDPVILASDDGQPFWYVGLCGSGAGMENLHGLAGSLVRSELKPDLFIVCAHLSDLVGHPTENEGRTIHYNLAEQIRERGLRGLARTVKSWEWVAPNKAHLNYWMRARLYSARVDLFQALHLDPRAFCAPDPDPWLPPERLGYPAKASEEFLRDQLSGYAGYGWFESKKYERSQESQARALIELMRVMRERGSKVILLLMPEHSELRLRIPEEASAYLRRALVGAFGDSSPTILDYRASIPDSSFSDYSHLNDQGRRQFSRLLAEWIRTNGDEIAAARKVLRWPDFARSRSRRLQVAEAAHVHVG
jgi:hypothetical protein